MVGDFVHEFLDAEVAGTEVETCTWGTRLKGRIRVDISGRSRGGRSSGQICRNEAAPSRSGLGGRQCQRRKREMVEEEEERGTAAWRGGCDGAVGYEGVKRGR